MSPASYYERNKEAVKARSLARYYAKKQEILEKAKVVRADPVYKARASVYLKEYRRTHSHRKPKEQWLENSGRFQPGQNGGANSWSWKGDAVGYRALHEWVERTLGRPSMCKNCRIDGLSGRSIHWANLSHEYKREVTDWMRLCARCHKAYDTGRLNLHSD